MRFCCTLIFFAYLAGCGQNRYQFESHSVYNNWEELDSTFFFSEMAKMYYGYSARQGEVIVEDSMIASFTYNIDSAIVENDTLDMNSTYFRVWINCFKYSSTAKANQAMQRFYNNLTDASARDVPPDPYGPSIKAFPVYYLITKQTIYQVSGDYSSTEEIGNVFSYLLKIVSRSEPVDKNTIIILTPEGKVELK